MNEYIKILNDAWKYHLKPKDINALNVISTFAGGGGSSLGYSMAGYKELLAIEWDKNAIETFKLNFPDIPIYEGDIAKLTVDECLKVTGLQTGELDVLDGSPPCQGFSMSGKRIMDDPRNQLFREFVRLLRGLMPKVFVMENVSGMVKGKMKLIFVEILRELKASGYKVSARLMNAMYFCVPQSRERMIFIGVRDDLNIEPSHPRAQRKPFSISIAVEDADISICPPIGNSKYARMYDYIPLPSANRLSSNASFITGKRGFSNIVKPNPNKPSPTIMKTQKPCGFVHWCEKRPLSIGEAKRIGSFPDHYSFTGKYEQQWARIGNSVPPLLMKAIAEHIKKEIFNKCI